MASSARLSSSSSENDPAVTLGAVGSSLPATAPATRTSGQPPAVWALSLACVVSFMGIGLVDPILPIISAELHASPSQTMLLFTSYLAVTGFVMFFTGWISSRIGVRRTLLLGIALVILGAALAGASGSVGEIIGFRAGWGLGNALFISTALAAIVTAANGGSARAIILYEAAIGLGMAIGPLVGGVLGSQSWRAPFFGTASLMLVALLAITVFFKAPDGAVHQRISPLAGFAALRQPNLLVLSVSALFFNIGFFTLLAYSPFPLEAAAKASGTTFGAHQLGFVFFGWGLALAISSVFIAPRLVVRLGLVRVLLCMFATFALLLAIMALAINNLAVLIAVIVLAGFVLGVVNMVLTETVMEATDLPRSVASSTYSGVRFLGGAAAPVIAGRLSANIGAGAPYWFAAAAVLVALGIVASSRGRLGSVTVH